MNKTLQEKLKDRQYRTLNFQLASDNKKKFDTDYYVEGYATKFEPYKLYEFGDEVVYEKFDKDCFKNCDMTDIIFQYNHQGRVFARKSNGTLIVEPDDVGLFVAADLSKSEDGRKLHEEITNGLTTKMSWGFIPNEYEFDEKTSTIVHKSIKKIYDVSAVSIPANDNTEIHARDFVNGVIEQNQVERLKREAKIKKLELKIKLNTVV